MIRSILAVLAGIVVLVVTSFAIEAVANPVMRMIGLFPDGTPSVAVRLVTFVYSTACLVAGAYLTAWVARRSPVRRHALITGAVQVVLTIPLIVGQPNFVPVWVWIVTVALVLPAAWCERGMQGDLRPEEQRVFRSLGPLIDHAFRALEQKRTRRLLSVELVGNESGDCAGNEYVVAGWPVFRVGVIVSHRPNRAPKFVELLELPQPGERGGR